MALTQQQKDAISRRLAEMEKETRDRIRQSLPQIADERFEDMAGTVHDAGDESVATMLEDFNHTLLERYLRELRDIHAARKRLEDDDLEYCDECGGEIGYQRLLANPVATRCIRCQSRHEKTYGVETTPRL